MVYNSQNELKTSSKAVAPFTAPQIQEQSDRVGALFTNVSLVSTTNRSSQLWSSVCSYLMASLMSGVFVN